MRVSGRGNPKARVIFLGEGPGENEERTGLAFVGNAGRVLMNTGQDFDLDIPRVGWITNLVKERVPDNEDPTPEDIARDLWELELEFIEHEPRVLVALGKVAIRWSLQDDTIDVEEAHGQAYRRVIFGRNAVVLCCYHPAAGLHNPDALGDFRSDIDHVARVLGGEPPDWAAEDTIRPNYWEKPGRTLIYGDSAIDTEGSKEHPFCLSYSWRDGIGVVVRAGHKVTIQGKPTFHYALHDLEVLRAMGIKVPDEYDDTMVMAYALQIRRGLKTLARRHCGMKMRDYTEVTFPYDRAQALAYLESLQDTDYGIPDPVLDTTPEGKNKVRQPQGLNRRINNIFTTCRKDPEADPRDLWYKIDASTREMAEVLHDPMPRFSLDLVPYEQWRDYAARDPDATLRIKPKLEALMDKWDVRQVYEMDMAVMPMIERMMQVGIKINRGYFPGLVKEFDRELEKLHSQIAKYNRGTRINPGSSQQTAELLFKRLRLRPTKRTKTGKPSTQDKVLEALKGHHPCVSHITDYREVVNLKDKFATILPKFASVEDDRIRGVIKPTTVVSGRYSMEDPNLMAIPTRTELGKKIRRGFIAEDGHLLGSCDQDQIEMRVMAHLSQDPVMCDLFNRHQDIHSQTAADMFGIPLDQVHPLYHRYPAKRVGFGVITGISGLGLEDQMKLAGIFKYSAEDCDGLIIEWFKKYKGVKKFLGDCREEAKSRGYVRAMYGRIRKLPGVYSRDRLLYSEALRESHSHIISASAQALMKRGMKRAWDWYKANPGKYEPLLQIHDEMVVESPIEHTEEVGRMLVSALTGDQLRVPVKAKVGWGSTWADVKD